MLKMVANEAADEKTTGGVPSWVRGGFFRGENEGGGFFQPPVKRTPVTGHT